MKQENPLHKIVGLLLSLALGVPSPALALKPQEPSETAGAEELKKALQQSSARSLAQRIMGFVQPTGLEENEITPEMLFRESAAELVAIYSQATTQVRLEFVPEVRKLGPPLIPYCLELLAAERPSRTETRWSRPRGAARVLAALGPDIPAGERPQVIGALRRLLTMREIGAISQFDRSMKGNAHTWLVWVLPAVIESLRELDPAGADTVISQLEADAKGRSRGILGRVVTEIIQQSKPGLEEGNYETGVERISRLMEQQNIQTPLKPGAVWTLSRLAGPDGFIALVPLDQKLLQWVPFVEGIPGDPRQIWDIWYRMVIGSRLNRDFREQHFNLTKKKTGARVSFLFSKPVIEHEQFKALRAGAIPLQLKEELLGAGSLADVPFLAQGEDSEVPRWLPAKAALTVEESLQAGAAGYKTNVMLAAQIPGVAYHPYWGRLNETNLQWVNARAAEALAAGQGRGIGYVSAAIIWAAPPKNYVPSADLAEELAKDEPASWAIDKQMEAWLLSEEKKRVEAGIEFAAAHAALTERIAGEWSRTPGLTLIMAAGPYFAETQDQWTRRRPEIDRSLERLRQVAAGKWVPLSRDREPAVYEAEVEEMGRLGIAVGTAAGRSVLRSFVDRSTGVFYSMRRHMFRQSSVVAAVNMIRFAKIFEDRQSAGVWETYGINAAQAAALTQKPGGLEEFPLLQSLRALSAGIRLRVETFGEEEESAIPAEFQEFAAAGGPAMLGIAQPLTPDDYAYILFGQRGIPFDDTLQARFVAAPQASEALRVLPQVSNTVHTAMTTTGVTQTSPGAMVLALDFTGIGITMPPAELIPILRRLLEVTGTLLAGTEESPLDSQVRDLLRVSLDGDLAVGERLVAITSGFSALEPPRRIEFLNNLVWFLDRPEIQQVSGLIFFGTVVEAIQMRTQVVQAVRQDPSGHALWTLAELFKTAPVLLHALGVRNIQDTIRADEGHPEWEYLGPLLLANLEEIRIDGLIQTGLAEGSLLEGFMYNDLADLVDQKLPAFWRPGFPQTAADSASTVQRFSGLLYFISGEMLHQIRVQRGEAKPHRWAEGPLYESFQSAYSSLRAELEQAASASPDRLVRFRAYTQLSRLQNLRATMILTVADPSYAPGAIGEFSQGFGWFSDRMALASQIRSALGFPGLEESRRETFEVQRVELADSKQRVSPVTVPMAQTGDIFLVEVNDPAGKRYFFTGGNDRFETMLVDQDDMQINAAGFMAAPGATLDVVAPRLPRPPGRETARIPRFDINIRYDRDNGLVFNWGPDTPSFNVSRIDRMEQVSFQVLKPELADSKQQASPLAVPDARQAHMFLLQIATSDGLRRYFVSPDFRSRLTVVDQNFFRLDPGFQPAPGARLDVTVSPRQPVRSEGTVRLEQFDLNLSLDEAGTLNVGWGPDTPSFALFRLQGIPRSGLEETYPAPVNFRTHPFQTVTRHLAFLNRDMAPIQLITERVLPDLAQRGRTTRSVEIALLGVSTGEEAARVWHAAANWLNANGYPLRGDPATRWRLKIVAVENAPNVLEEAIRRFKGISPFSYGYSDDMRGKSEDIEALILAFSREIIGTIQRDSDLIENGGIEWIEGSMVDPDVIRRVAKAGLFISNTASTYVDEQLRTAMWRQFGGNPDAWFITTDPSAPPAVEASRAHSFRPIRVSTVPFLEEQLAPVTTYYFGVPTRAGLEETVRVMTIEELAAKGVDQAANAQAAGYSKAALVPVGSARAQKAQIDLYTQPSVSPGAVGILPDGWAIRDFWVVPSNDPQTGNGLLRRAAGFFAEGRTVVIALDPKFRAGLQMPENHPVALLLSPETIDKIDRDALAAFLARPDALANLILDLTRGTIERVTIDGVDYFALFA